MQECSALGIDCSNIRGGLLGLTAELPALAAAAVEALQAEGVSQGMQYYASVAGSQQQEQGEAALLPVLAEVREGRTEAPAAAAAAEAPARSASGDGGDAAAADSGGSAATGLQLDWDLGAALGAAGGEEAGGGGAAVPAAGISWDLDASDLAAAAEDGGDDAAGAGGGAAGGISWEVEVDPADVAAAADVAADVAAEVAPAEIAWDIDISGVGEESEQQEQQLAGARQQGAGAGEADGPSAAAAAAAAADEPATIRRLIEDAAYRARLLDDLYELRAFLMQVCVCVCECGRSSCWL